MLLKSIQMTLLVAMLGALQAPNLISAEIPVASNPEAFPAREQLQLFILAGQSNMAGVGGYVHPRHQQLKPRAFILNRNMLLMHENKTQCQPMPEPLFEVFGADKTILGGRGVGPEWGFVTTLLEQDPEMRIGIVKIPASGSNIERWIDDKSLPRGGADYYDNVVETVLEAKKHGVLKGFLWHQGESNSASCDYDQLFERMISGYREAFGEPDLPAIAGTVCEDGSRRHPVNDGLKKAAESLKHVRVVSSLRTLSDNVHYDADSQDELGRRYANAYLTLSGKPQQLEIETTLLPEGSAGCWYVADLQAIGGDGSHRTWKAEGLPEGLTIENRTLQGVLPAQVGAVSFTVEVSDGSGSASRKLKLPVVAVAKDRIEIIPSDCFTISVKNIHRGAKQLLVSPDSKYSNRYRSYLKFTLPAACRGGQLEELRLPMLLSGGPFPLSLQVAVLTDPNWNLDETKRYGRNNPPPKPESRVIGTLDIPDATERELVLKLPADLAQQVNDQGSIAFEITDPRGERGGSTFLTSSRGEKPPLLIIVKY